MTTQRRLIVLEDNPQVRYRQELARLRRQEAKPLEDVLEELNAAMRISEEANTAACAQLTSAQCLALLRLYDNTDAETAELDRLEGKLLTLEEQAQQHMEQNAHRRK